MGGMDYLPWEPLIARHLSDLLKVTFCGDYQGFLKMLEDKSDEQVQEMLKRRECLLNVNAIFHCIIGARTFADERPEMKPVKEAAKKNLNIENEHEHMKILIKLLILGVDVNVH